MIRRISLIAWQDFRTYLRRPMVWVWLGILGLLCWGLCQGGVQIGTGGDSRIGGTKQHLSSEFELTRLMAAMTMLVNGFFATVLFGMAVIRDFDTGIMPLIHSSRMRAWEYLTGKFLGCALLVVAVLGANSLLMMFFMYVVPPATRVEYFGPFALAHFWKPVVKFVLPALFLLGGAAFALGTLSRKPVLVFTFPVVFLVVFGLFLNNWSPFWLPVWINNALGLIDPYGLRWLNEEYFNVDRGAEFYNTRPVTLGSAFAFSRVVVAGLGLLLFLVSIPVFRRQLAGSRHGSLSAASHTQPRSGSLTDSSARVPAGGLATLGMARTGGGLLSDTWNIFCYELRELRNSPSLYLFVPFILMEVVATSWFAEGAFGTPLLHTSGMLAEQVMEVLGILGCLLMMFYTVESQLRERIKRLAPIYYSTPARSFAMLLGKSLANTGVCLIIMAAALVACLIILVIEGTVKLELFPFLAYWILLLMPTFILWGSFITLIIVLTRSRYTTWAIGAGVLIATLYFQLGDKLTWFDNWLLIGVVPWSDISSFEMDLPALWLNRLFALSIAMLFTWLAARMFWRRGIDAVQLSTRLKPGAIGRFALQAVPFLILPLVTGSWLWTSINRGYQGDVVRDLQKKYWQQNVATWTDVQPPSVSGVDIRLAIQPSSRSLAANGLLRLTNDQDEPVSQFAVSSGTHWRNIKWQLGRPFVVDETTPAIPRAESLQDCEPDNRSGLHVFHLDSPLAPGESMILGYSFDGHFPGGISRNGGGSGEFVLPSGVVLTSFSNAMLPSPGFVENVGLDEEDRPEEKVYEDDFYEEELKPLFGGGDRFHVRTTISGPADFRFNGVGILTDEQEHDGQRTVVWETDSPVSFFNVVGGKWKVHRGKSTEIYYHAGHDFNVEQISEAMEAARAWYSRWFAPYPWQDLRLSEFPNMATYAQGFPTNITFSEGIGFLTRDQPGADAPFLVAAHEAAHQWWGNILVPGKGPGGNILSEGMAHFSTGLLFDQVRGERSRISFFRQIEDQYGERRSVDSERPLVEIDGSVSGDTTVTYDKGGWVFWMLLNHMGRTENLQGLQSFIRKYGQSPNDYPVLQDFVSHMRHFADDPQAYDAFVQQWFFEVVVPQYELHDVRLKQRAGQWVVSGSVRNVGTGKMPLEIAAASRERWVDNQPNPLYQDARTRITIGADETVEFEIRASFQPDRVVVDPDARVLQLKRKYAEHEF